MDDEDDYPKVELRPRRTLAHGRKDEIFEYSLMLASQGVKHWTEFDGGEYVLTLDEQDFPLAAKLLDLYRSENQGFADEEEPLRALDLLVSPLLYLAVPAGCYFWVELQPWADWMHKHGSADAAAMLDGEWWRALTATALHADHEHLIGNLLSGYFIFNLLNHRLGIGTLMAAATVGAFATNVLAALASGPGHVSIGFSTVVFCALGMLAALETLRLAKRRGAREARERKLRGLAPLLGAFFLAVYMGFGEHADIKAHFYGFGLGVLLGPLCRLLPRKLAAAPWQGALVGLVYAVYALCWRLAMR